MRYGYVLSTATHILGHGDWPLLSNSYAPPPYWGLETETGASLFGHTKTRFVGGEPVSLRVQERILQFYFPPGIASPTPAHHLRQLRNGTIFLILRWTPPGRDLWLGFGAYFLY